MANVMRDTFSPNLYRGVEMTDVINMADRTSTEIRDLGIFEEKRVSTTMIGLERVKGTINLVKPSARGSAGQQRTKDKRDALAIATVRYDEESTITSDEIRDVFATGGNFLKSVEGVRNEKIAEIARDLDHTEEHVFQGALDGKVIDKDGEELYDLYDLFGFDRPDIITLDINATEPLKAWCAAVRRQMAKALGVDGQAGFVIRARVGNAFYDHIANLPEVIEAYKRYQESLFLREGAVGYDEFAYGGIVWRNVQPSDDGAIGVAEEQVKLFPVVKGLYKAFYSPSDKLSDIGGAGLPRYSWGTPDRKDRSIEIEGQMNLVALMAKPEALLTGELS